MKVDARGILVRVGETQGNMMPAAYVSAEHLHNPPPPDAAPPKLEAWTPGIDDVRQAEQGLRAFLDKALYGRSSPFGDSESRYIHRHYVRQYYGMTLDGRRVIHLELISDGISSGSAGKEEQWRVLQVDGYDLSTSWIWLYYDLERREYFGYGHTGDA